MAPVYGYPLIVELGRDPLAQALARSLRERRQAPLVASLGPGLDAVSLIGRLDRLDVVTRADGAVEVEQAWSATWGHLGAAATTVLRYAVRGPLVARLDGDALVLGLDPGPAARFTVRSLEPGATSAWSVGPGELGKLGADAAVQVDLTSLRRSTPSILARAESPTGALALQGRAASVVVGMGAVIGGQPLAAAPAAFSGFGSARGSDDWALSLDRAVVEAVLAAHVDRILPAGAGLADRRLVVVGMSSHRSIALRLTAVARNGSDDQEVRFDASASLSIEQGVTWARWEISKAEVFALGEWHDATSELRQQGAGLPAGRFVLGIPTQVGRIGTMLGTLAVQRIGSVAGSVALGGRGSGQPCSNAGLLVEPASLVLIGTEARSLVVENSWQPDARYQAPLRMFEPRLQGAPSALELVTPSAELTIAPGRRSRAITLRCRTPTTGRATLSLPNNAERSAPIVVECYEQGGRVLVPSGVRLVAYHRDHSALGGFVHTSEPSVTLPIAHGGGAPVRLSLTLTGANAHDFEIDRTRGLLVGGSMGLRITFRAADLRSPDRRAAVLVVDTGTVVHRVAIDGEVVHSPLTVIGDRILIARGLAELRHFGREEIERLFDPRPDPWPSPGPTPGPRPLGPWARAWAGARLQAEPVVDDEGTRAAEQLDLGPHDEPRG